jgi:hypothetical protein
MNSVVILADLVEVFDLVWCCHMPEVYCSVALAWWRINKHFLAWGYDDRGIVEIRKDLPLRNAGYLIFNPAVKLSNVS